MSKLISVQMVEDTWYQLDSPETTECCDCSMIHVTEFKLSNGIVYWRSKVDKAATRQKRKENGIKVIKKKKLV
jgi:hypothetical protein